MNNLIDLLMALDAPKNKCCLSGCYKERTTKHTILSEQLSKDGTLPPVCEEHNLMFTYITRAMRQPYDESVGKRFNTIHYEGPTELISEEDKKLMKKASIISEILNSAYVSQNVKDKVKATEILLKIKDAPVLTVVFIGCTVIVNLDDTLDMYQEGVDNGEMTEREYLERCNILKLMNDVRGEYGAQVA